MTQSRETRISYGISTANYKSYTYWLYAMILYSFIGVSQSSTPAPTPDNLCYSFTDYYNGYNGYHDITITENSNIIIDSCDAEFDTVLSLIEDYSIIAQCDDCGRCGSNAILQVNDVAPGNYQISIRGFQSSSDRGYYVVNVYCDAVVATSTTETPLSEKQSFSMHELVFWNSPSAFSLSDYNRTATQISSPNGGSGETILIKPVAGPYDSVQLEITALTGDVGLGVWVEGSAYVMFYNSGNIAYSTDNGALSQGWFPDGVNVAQVPGGPAEVGSILSAFIGADNNVTFGIDGLYKNVPLLNGYTGDIYFFAWSYGIGNELSLDLSPPPQTFSNEELIYWLTPTAFVLSDSNRTITQISPKSSRILIKPAAGAYDSIQVEITALADYGGVALGVWVEGSGFVMFDNEGDIINSSSNGLSSWGYEINGVQQTVPGGPAGVGSVLSASVDADNNVIFGIDGSSRNVSLLTGYSGDVYFFASGYYEGNVLSLDFTPSPTEYPTFDPSEIPEEQTFSMKELAFWNSPTSFLLSDNNRTATQISSPNGGSGETILITPIAGIYDSIELEITALTGDVGLGVYIEGEAYVMFYNSGNIAYSTDNGVLSQGWFPDGVNVAQVPGGPAEVGSILSASVDRDNNVIFGIDGAAKNVSLLNGYAGTVYFFVWSYGIGNELTFDLSQIFSTQILAPWYSPSSFLLTNFNKTAEQISEPNTTYYGGYLLIEPSAAVTDFVEIQVNELIGYVGLGLGVWVEGSAYVMVDIAGRITYSTDNGETRSWWYLNGGRDITDVADLGNPRASVGSIMSASVGTDNNVTFDIDGYSMIVPLLNGYTGDIYFFVWSTEVNNTFTIKQETYEPTRNPTMEPTVEIITDDDTTSTTTETKDGGNNSDDAVNYMDLKRIAAVSILFGLLLSF